MPDLRRTTCRLNKGGCGGRVEDVGPLSWAGRCVACSKGRAGEAADAMYYHRGPYFERWRRAMAACVGGVLVEDLEAMLDDRGESA